MENCCDVALYPLGLEPFERPVGLKLSSHLSDKEADSGRVLPDVTFMFQTVSQPLIPPATRAYIFFSCLWVFLTLSGYHCIHRETANDVTRLCFISSGHGGKQQSRCNSAQVPPLSGSTICCQGMSAKWILLWLKNKSKVYMYNMPQTWKTVRHLGCVCLAILEDSQSVLNIWTQRRAFTHYEQGVISFFRIWVIFPWQFWVRVVCRAQQSVSGACWPQNVTAWAEDSGFHKDSEIWCSWVRIFSLQLFILLTDNWGRIRAEMPHATAVLIDAWEVEYIFRRSHLCLQKLICTNCRGTLGGRHQQWISIAIEPQKRRNFHWFMRKSRTNKHYGLLSILF